jgi:hypothetical protein
MQVRTNVKAGGQSLNHNQPALRVKTGVKAGGISSNHNQVLVGTMPRSEAG